MCWSLPPNVQKQMCRLIGAGSFQLEQCLWLRSGVSPGLISAEETFRATHLHFSFVAIHLLFWLCRPRGDAGAQEGQGHKHKETRSPWLQLHVAPHGRVSVGMQKTPQKLPVLVCNLISVGRVQVEQCCPAFGCCYYTSVSDQTQFTDIQSPILTVCHARKSQSTPIIFCSGHIKYLWSLKYVAFPSEWQKKPFSFDRTVAWSCKLMFI